MRQDAAAARTGRSRRTREVQPTWQPHVLPATTHSYLSRAAESLSEAMAADEVTTRYACAHVSALRAAAALLAARARPSTSGRRPQKNAWVLLAEVAPELGEWAAFFAAGASKRAAAEAGSTRSVTEREADDLVRDADRFLAVVEQSLGLVPHAPTLASLPWDAAEGADRADLADVADLGERLGARRVG
ncbi:SAV_6107 family HEPN domain-containing protein [Nocardioides flavescens]|uniref:Chromosome segregation protein SMC n=1 Tax=Nocardioides flavescens TaxID=2691959 RepID=A0A6L7F2A3_9ACTN|nr:SAV_6107 family HEPN domain-containing protein [Nocardioides flavescens]MXG90822.1 chromosome segregation protein SMC [Nocardioides flavescens]